MANHEGARPVEALEPDRSRDRRIEELLLLQRSAQRINSILDLDVLLEEIIADVRQTFGYSRPGVFLKDDESDDVITVAGWVGYHLKKDGASTPITEESRVVPARFHIGKGIIGHVAETGETHYAPDVRVDPYYKEDDVSTTSEVAIPLKARGRLVGIFMIAHTELDAFPPNRIELLETLAGHMAIAIENARMFKRVSLAKERMIKELDEAQGIQRSLFPGDCPGLPKFGITGFCLPSREVGGDWYDYIRLGDGQMALVLADVSGKGMGAALLMSSTRAVLRQIARWKKTPAEVLSTLNHVLVHDLPTARFVTMVYGILDSQRRTFTYANAGHLQPVFCDGIDSRFLETELGLPLGIMEGPYSEHEIEMPSGSRLLLYSDGVTEATNSTLEEYGQERLRDQMLSQWFSLNLLLQDVNSFTGGSAISDDVTAVLVRQNG